MKNLYTFGYLKSNAEKIIRELIAVKTPVIDIRENPASKNHRYTQEGFRNRAGIQYHHIQELGNLLYKEALTGKFTEPHIQLRDTQTGLTRLDAILHEHGRAAIFCACAGKNCHRFLVSNLAREQLGVKVIHL